LVWILKYSKNSPVKGLIYDCKANTRIVGYSDANWAMLQINRHSILLCRVLLGGNLVAWKSKEQNTVVRSTIEAQDNDISHL